jgi:hypothetical protein
LFNKNDWKFTNNIWKGSGKWAGTCYEQGALGTMINHVCIHVKPWWYMNNHYSSGKTGFEQHFCGCIGKYQLSRT